MPSTRRLLPLLLAASAGLLPAATREIETETIAVDVGRTLNAFAGGHPLGANLCWYADTEDAAATSVTAGGYGVLRFPFGHRADNYLWDTKPWPTRPGDDLVPRIASFAEKPAEEPGVINPDGTFRHHLDTDAYMRLVRRTGTTPIMMVNVLSYKYPGGPSFADLKESAVEWVRYCNVTSDYGIRYWEIGNEVDLLKSPVSLDEYAPLFLEFTRAMKEVDPTIQVGLGLNTNSYWMTELLNRLGLAVDFVVAHQYNPNTEPRIGSYDDYRRTTKRFARRTVEMYEATQRSSHPARKTLPMFITEFGSFSPAGLYAPDDRDQDMWKSFITLDLVNEMLRIPTVRYLTYWSLTDPARGPDTNMVGLASSRDGRLLPNGQALAFIARHLGTEIVHSTLQSGPVRSLASLDRSNGQLAVWLINRESHAVPARVSVTGARLDAARAAWRYAGSGPHDTMPTTVEIAAPDFVPDGLAVELPPCSATVYLFDVTPET